MAHHQRILLLSCTLLLIAADVLAQGSNMAPPPSEWKRYRVEGEEFSVILPTLPAMSTSETLISRRQMPRRQRQLGVYADGVVYTVYCYENPRPRESVEKFIRAEFKPGLWDPGSEQDIPLNGLTGKQHFSKYELGGTRQIFESKGKIYVFQAMGAPADDPRVKQFFASISFGGKVEGEKVSDGPGIVLDPLARPSAFANSGEKVFTTKEVDTRVLVVTRPEPRYTEQARQNEIQGVVVLKAILTSGGSILDIKVVSGLPYHLTDQAIAAAKKLRFIPAIKDGKFVSVSMQLEYYFNLHAI